MRSSAILVLAVPFAVFGFTAETVWSHGDVAPQPVNTDALPDIDETEWALENPYRSMDEEVYRTAVSIGASGYNQNCARCHGLEAVSGGVAPDLRYLEADDYGDEWYVERFINGYTQNGVNKMPAFGDLLGQKAAWAIRSYIETRPDDGALDEFSDDLVGIRDELQSKAAKLSNGTDYDALAPEIDNLKAELDEIAGQVPAASGAEFTDSPASRAYAALDGTVAGVKQAEEILTIGLSAAQ
ncbi:MAG: cytochrome c-550 PedF [Geminicoccaceae bacterium]